ncbi:hypothetical protein [Paludibacterium purpuratum]|uniref:Uncharacterized protein n=1 Tax=Paludibacterium purpuratum TaxID=1144873 RepID=A0A4R7B5V1_9NEIS|nr:hypothetical protein [Paludibacterium purpuratum]TDR79981.1 hypothetical protein DFP86_106121 [Paludibacterium purpuratum]
MNAELNLTHLSMLCARLTRMRHSNAELLLATGLDEVLPALDRLTDTLPTLYRVTDELGDATYDMRQVLSRLHDAGTQPLPADQLYLLLDRPFQRLRAQHGRLAALI